MSAKKMNLLEAVNLAMHDAMEADPKVLVFGEDVADAEGGGVVGATKGLEKRFGSQRVRSTPIAEQAIIGAAIGASLAGYKPVPEIMLMNFTTVAMDMIVNHAAKLRFMTGGQTNVPITIRTMTGSGMGNGGQHSVFLEGWFAHTAGLKVVIPSNPADAYGLLLSCIDDPDPCIFVETLPAYWTAGEPPERGRRLPLGQAHIVREGRDLSVISYGRQVNDAVAVANKLETKGISVEVVDLRTVSPLDMKTVLASVGKTRRAVVLHEAVRKFGPGGEIASEIGEVLFGQLLAPVMRIGAKFAPVPFSKTLEAAFLPNQAELEAAVRGLVARG